MGRDGVTQQCPCLAPDPWPLAGAVCTAYEAVLGQTTDELFLSRSRAIATLLTMLVEAK